MKLQLKIQRLTILFVLIAFVVAFVFSIGLATDVYDMLFNFAGTNGDSSKDRVDGAYYYYLLQPFNKSLVALALGGLLICLSLFATHTSIRRIFYLSNYITTGVVAAYAIAISVWAIPSVIYYRDLYLTTVDFVQLEKWVNQLRITTFTDSTFWFDICIAAYIVLIIAALALIGNAIWKFLLLKKEKHLLSSATKIEEEVTVS